MKKRIFNLIVIIVVSTQLFAQNPVTIDLPQPSKEGGMPLTEALMKRQSSRNFDGTRPLTEQQISNLLWSAYGFNRDEKRTVPSTNDAQEFTLYIFLPSGVYIWNPKSNILTQIIAKDLRSLTGNQDFVREAAINIVYVADITKIKETENQEERINLAYADCGFIAQNVNLYSASEGLACVVRSYINRPALAQMLQLPEGQLVILAQSIGLEKK